MFISRKVKTTVYEFERDGETYEIYVIYQPNDIVEFYLKNTSYGDLAFECGLKKDDIKNVLEIIENNLDNWIFYYQSTYED